MRGMAEQDRHDRYCNGWSRAFGAFRLKAFSHVEKVVALVDSNFIRAQTLARNYQTTAYSDLKPVLDLTDKAIVTLRTML
jgi:hypothetical protein